MKDPPFEAVIDAVRERWTQAGVLAESVADAAQLATFEQRYGVVLPPALRYYFTTVNGTAIGACGMEDGDNLMGFWHLDQVHTFAEEDATGTHPDAGTTFVFADHSIWVFAFGIQLSADPNALAPIVTDCAPAFHVVAASFTEFLEAYLRDDAEVLFP